MENYKADYINPETFEKTEIETKIPTDLIVDVKHLLDQSDRYMVTQIMINPEDKLVCFGIMDLQDRTLKYKLSITSNNKSTFK